MVSATFKFYFASLVCLFTLQSAASVSAGSVESDLFANQCPQVSSFSSVNLWQDATNLKVSSCVFAGRLASVVDSISAWAPVTDKVTLSLKHSASGASYDGVAILSAAENLFIEGSLKKETHLRTEQGNFVTFAHEYGHVILTDWLTRDIPEFKQIRAEITESMLANQKVYFLANQRALIAKHLVAAASAEEESYLKQKQQEVERELAQAYFIAGDFTFEQNRVLNLLAPYHELFADVVAVLYAEDPQAMRHAVEFPKATGKDLYMAEARDFTVKHDSNTWIDATAHFLFSPVRGELYSKHWIKNYSSAEKRDYLQRVYLLLKADILRRWNQITTDVPEANRKLIESLSTF